MRKTLNSVILLQKKTAGFGRDPDRHRNIIITCYFGQAIDAANVQIKMNNVKNVKKRDLDKKT